MGQHKKEKLNQDKQKQKLFGIVCTFFLLAQLCVGYHMKSDFTDTIQALDAFVCASNTCYP